MKNTTIAKDVLIVGGGPAGLSASLWCADLGLSSVVFDRSSHLGGQLLRIHNPITNYIGLESVDGRELRDRFMLSFAGIDHEHHSGSEVVNVDTETLSVSLADDRLYKGRAIVIATGVRRRTLGVPGELEFAGKGILDSGAKERRSAAGKRVAVIGGGDAAAENALMLAEFAEKVVLIHRGPRLSARDEFLKPSFSHPKIEIRLNTTVTGFNGDQTLEKIGIEGRTNGSAEDLALDLAVIRIGVQPNTEFLGGQIELDHAGYAIVTRTCETSNAGVYAVGDVSNASSPTISTAVGTGATASKAIFSLLKLSLPV